MLFSDAPDDGNDREVLLKILSLKARNGTAKIILGEFLRLLDRPGQKST
jgi:hypothetical protein